MREVRMLVAAVVASVISVSQVHAANHMVVLLDRTGSMLALRATGGSRCHDALAQAIQDVQTFFDQNPSGSLAVWTFADAGPVDLTGGFVGRTSALNALNGLGPENCSGLTPLAQAMCQASDLLNTSFPGAPQGTKILAVSSDGGENNSGGECWGPPSSICPPPPGNYDAGSWEQKVWAKLASQNTVLVRYWASVLTTRSLVDVETGREVQGCTDAVIFQDIAASTGGSYDFMDDNYVPPIIPSPSMSITGVVVLLALVVLIAVSMQRKHLMARRPVR